MIANVTFPDVNVAPSGRPVNVPPIEVGAEEDVDDGVSSRPISGWKPSGRTIERVAPERLRIPLLPEQRTVGSLECNAVSSSGPLRLTPSARLKFVSSDFTWMGPVNVAPVDDRNPQVESDLDPFVVEGDRLHELDSAAVEERAVRQRPVADAEGVRMTDPHAATR